MREDESGRMNGRNIEKLKRQVKELTSDSVDVKEPCRASLVAQWLGVCLPMRGTRVRALVWEDPTCRGATRPVSHNY